MNRLPLVAKQAGFSLTELAVVLVIVALLIGGLLLPLSAQMDLRAANDTERVLADIREALVGFGASHAAGDGKPYLPCPDTDDDGIENRNGAVCSSQEGRVPWVDLGVGRVDAWNNRLRYRVGASFSRKDIGFSLTTTGTLRVCGLADCSVILASNLPVVIVSHGKNGAGALNAAGGSNALPAGNDELANVDNNSDFVSSSLRPDFDDQLTWISTNILIARMVAAGRLP